MKILILPLPIMPLKKVILQFVACLVMVAVAFLSPSQVQAKARTDINDIRIGELEFKDAQVQDAVRIISELTGVNIVATEAAGEELVTVFVRDLRVADIIDSICRISGLWYRYNNETGVFIIMTTDEYESDIVIFKNEPTQMFQLKYLNVGVAARTIADLFGDRVHLAGKANMHLGSDYKVAETYEKFADDFDDAGSELDNDDDDDDDDDDDEDNDNDSEFMDDLDLTAGQLRLLENRAKKGVNRVDERLISLVEQRTEVPIYVTINRMHNMLFVRTSDEKAMEQIAQIIDGSDQQVPEVLLEMKVLAVQITDSFQSAFDISGISGNQQTGPDDGQAINPLNSVAESVGSSLLGVGNYGTMENSTFVFQALSGNIRVRMQLLEEQGNIKALATPMLLAANNHPAKLFIGEETVITTGFTTQEVSTTGSGNVVVSSVPLPETEVREIGNSLTILPSINADRSVVLRIVHENSSVEIDGGRIPLIVGSQLEYVNIDTVNTSTLEGTALAQDGMTIAVGGMMRTTYNDSESKVPILGDIPLLGFFFKEKIKVESKTELILLITPHVISAPIQGEAVTRHRLGELSDHPSALDGYLDNLDNARSEREKQLIAKSLAENGPTAVPITDTSSLEKSFVEMTKVAVTQVRVPYLIRQPVGPVRPVSLLSLGEVPVFNQREVVCKPVGSWTNGYNYITALIIENRSHQQLELDLANLKGDWRAATIEYDTLAPKGEEGEFTYLYLISDQNFEAAIKQEVE